MSGYRPAPESRRRTLLSIIEAWASYQIRKIAGCACAGNAGNVFPRRRLQRKPLVSDPGMHHGTCVTHVPWCMSGSLTHGDGENVPGIPGACASAILRIWQETHKANLQIKTAADLFYKIKASCYDDPPKLHHSSIKQCRSTRTKHCYVERGTIHNPICHIRINILIEHVGQYQCTGNVH